MATAKRIPAHTTILNEVENRLNNIREAYGYATTVQVVRRASIQPFSEHDLPIVEFFIDDDSVSLDQYRYETHTAKLVIGMRLVARDENLNDIAADMGADIVTALNRAANAPSIDNDASNDLGNLVQSVFHTGFEYEIGTEEVPYVTVVMEFDVVYKTPCGDPYTVEA